VRRANQRRALIVVQRRREDLRGRGGSAVDQHHQPGAIADVTRLGLDAKFCIRCAPIGTDDGAVIEKIIGDLRGRIQHTAGIVAQIDHESLDLLCVRALEPSTSCSSSLAVLSVKLVMRR
jgi:hypothetical protein